MTVGTVASWCMDKTSAAKAAEFFVANVEAARYASPADYIAGRMDPDMAGWAKEFLSVITHEFEETAADNEHQRLAVVKIGEEIVALAVVVIAVSVRGSYCILEDFVVKKDMRQHGLGKSFLKWIEASCLRRNIRHIFLDVTSKNTEAVIFFAGNDFSTCGVQMHKVLAAEVPESTPPLGLQAVNPPE